MTITIVAVLVFAVLVTTFLLAGSLRHNRKQEERNRLLQQVQRLGAGYGLAFTNIEILGDAVIGLDDRQQKLLILKTGHTSPAVTKLVDAATLKNCFLEQHYGPTVAESSGEKKPEPLLEKISLHLLLSDDTREEIVFYSHRANPVMEMVSLANKARHWKTALNKMQRPETKFPQVQRA